MRYLKSYKIFERSDQDFSEIKAIVYDSLSDLTDDGFDVIVYGPGYGYDEDIRKLAVRISKPGMEYNRQSFLGFNVSDIMSSIDELKSQLSLETGDILYHIKGYEPATWYSMDANFKNLPEEPIDQLSIEFLF